MPSTWSTEADKNLLLTIIEAGNISKIDWPATVAAFAAKGYNFTHEAVRQHYQRIRRDAKKGDSVENNPSAGSPTNSKVTPTSRNKQSTVKANSHATSRIDGDDDEEMNPTPTKRKRGRPVLKEKVEKVEDEDLGGYAGQNAAQIKTECADEDTIDLEESEGLYRD